MDDSIIEETRKKAAEIVRIARIKYIVGGASPKRAWDQVASRAASASRRSTSISEWFSKFHRDLQISDPGNESSEHVKWISENCEPSLFFNLIDSEYQYIVALARLSHQNKKEENKSGT